MLIVIKVAIITETIYTLPQPSLLYLNNLGRYMYWVYFVNKLAYIAALQVSYRLHPCWVFMRNKVLIISFMYTSYECTCTLCTWIMIYNILYATTTHVFKNWRKSLNRRIPIIWQWDKNASMHKLWYMYVTISSKKKLNCYSSF